MKKLVFTLLAVFSLGFAAMSQTDNGYQIETQRPTLSESSTLVPTNVLQVENGGTLTDGEDAYNSFFRYSPVNVIELRASTTWDNNNPDLGAKLQLIRGDNRTGVSVSYVVTTTTTSGLNVSDHRIALTRGFGDNISGTLNVGNDAGGLYQIATACYSITDDIGCFAEFRNSDNIDVFNCGATWRMCSRWQLDAHGGFTEMGDQTVTTVGLGLSMAIQN